MSNLTIRQLAVLTALVYTSRVEQTSLSPDDAPHTSANIDLLDQYLDLRDNPNAADVLPTLLELADLNLITEDPANEAWTYDNDHELIDYIFAIIPNLGTPNTDTEAAVLSLFNIAFYTTL